MKLTALALGLVLFFGVACQQSDGDKSVSQPTAHALSVNCENKEANLVPGLSATMGQIPATPANVAAGIQKYKELSVSDSVNAEFYNKQSELMTAKLNEFNAQYAQVCGQ
ncbi:MAG: hypothetical protein JNL11_18765 [Bdellovibrionaceae bacterium]|nr:hypothetical protein [Pseudobdellovibrionaceae bacterium]